MLMDCESLIFAFFPEWISGSDKQFRQLNIFTDLKVANAQVKKNYNLPLDLE